MALSTIQDAVAKFGRWGNGPADSSKLPVYWITDADATVPPTQATAIANAPCKHGINIVMDSGSADDAVALPPCSRGQICIVHNADASLSIEIWPFTGDSIKEGAANAKDSAALAAAGTRIYMGDDSGSTWEVLGADT